MKESEKWDRVHRQFDVYSGKTDPRVADNVLIAWPALLKAVGARRRRPARVLDYGCGTGAFCRMLHGKGFAVTGIDLSRRMIAAAKRRSSREITYLCGSAGTLRRTKGTFSAVTSMMVLMFIEDLSGYLPLFRRLLEDRGTIAFAVLNPAFVERCREAGIPFGALDRRRKPPVLTVEMRRGISFRIYLRSEEEYRRLFGRHGFEPAGAHYPPFTERFVRTYGWRYPADVPEFMVLSFRKRG